MGEKKVDTVFLAFFFLDWFFRNERIIDQNLATIQVSDCKFGIEWGYLKDSSLMQCSRHGEHVGFGCSKVLFSCDSDFSRRFYSVSSQQWMKENGLVLQQGWASKWMWKGGFARFFSASRLSYCKEACTPKVCSIHPNELGSNPSPRPQAMILFTYSRLRFVSLEETGSKYLR